MLGNSVCKEGPAILLRPLAKALFAGIVVEIRAGSADGLVSGFECAAKTVIENLTAALDGNVEEPGILAGVGSDKVCDPLSGFRFDQQVNVVVHRTNPDDSDSEPPSGGADQGEKSQKVADSVKQQFPVRGILVDMKNSHGG